MPRPIATRPERIGTTRADRQAAKRANQAAGQAAAGGRAPVHRRVRRHGWGSWQPPSANLATRRAPAGGGVGGKGAEIAAIGAERAGPLAQRAAEATAHASVRVAERSRT